MRTAISAVVPLLLCLAGCTSTTACSTALLTPIFGTPDMPNVESKPVVSRAGIGHVCPMGEKLALTAWHVEGWRSPLMPPIQTIALPLMGEIDGRPVTLIRVWSDQRRDLSMVVITGPAVFNKFYPQATEVPKPGERLWIRWFDVEKGFAGMTVEVRVLRHEFGHLYLKPESEPFFGASGSCVLNKAEEVVGIYTGAYPERDSDGNVWWMGDAELVAGPWGTYHEDFLEVQE